MIEVLGKFHGIPGVFVAALFCGTLRYIPNNVMVVSSQVALATLLLELGEAQCLRTQLTDSVQDLIKWYSSNTLRIH